MSKNESTKKEYITEEIINKYMKMHTYANIRGEINKTSNKYFIKGN